MYGNDSKPSRIWSFGAKEPVQGLQTIYEQMVLMGRYRNKLVELELARHDASNALLLATFPQIAQLSQECEQLASTLEAMREEMKQANAQARSRTASKAERQPAIDLRKQLATLRASLREQRQAAWSDEALQASLQQIEDEHAAAKKEAQHQSKLIWGNYLAVEQAAKAFKGKRPRYKRSGPYGRIVVQCQNGLAIKDAWIVPGTVPTTGQFRLERTVANPLPAAATQPAPGSKSRARLTFAHAWFRLGSEGNKRKPIWAVVPVVMHRLPPESARIKWAYLRCDKVGTRRVWSVQLVLSQDSWPRDDLASEGSVAIDIGWRLLPSGEMRVAYAVGSDGLSEELRLPFESPPPGQELPGRAPSRLMTRPAHSESLRSIRARLFDQHRGSLVAWLKQHDHPQWLREMTATLSAWKSPARLASVALAWREQRFAGDEEVFVALEAWRAQDKHLYDWEAFQRLGTTRARDDYYRKWVASLSRRYHTVVVEDCDLRKLCRSHQPEDDDATAREVRAQQKLAAVGRLRELLLERFAQTKEVKTADSTRECHACGNLCDVQGEMTFLHTCEGCGITWDIDENAARVLLARGQVVNGSEKTKKCKR